MWKHSHPSPFPLKFPFWLISLVWSRNIFVLVNPKRLHSSLHLGGCQVHGLPVLVLGELPDETLLFQQGQDGTVLSLGPITDMDALRFAQTGIALHKVSNCSRQLAYISTEHTKGLNAPAW